MPDQVAREKHRWSDRSTVVGSLLYTPCAECGSVRIQRHGVHGLPPPTYLSGVCCGGLETATSPPCVKPQPVESHAAQDRA